MLVRLEPGELRELALLLDGVAEDLAALARPVPGGTAADGKPWSAGGGIRGVADWVARSAGLLRRRADLADLGERLGELLPALPLALPRAPGAAEQAPAPAPAPARATATDRRVRALEAVLRAAPREPGARARVVADHLRRLPAGEAAALVAAAPELVGGLDGAPEELRYAANDLRLRRALADAERRLADLPAPDRAGLAGALVRQHLAGLRALASPRLGADGVPLPRQWLRLDLAGAGRGVEVIGATASTSRLADAAAVGVLVPGMGSRLLPPAPGWTEGAGRLAVEAARVTGPGTVVVAWQGYAAPRGADVLSPAAARAGGRELAGFVRGLGAVTAAPVALLGHSYGSVVVAEAARQAAAEGPGPLPVRAVAVFGSPGLGREVRGVADLGLGRGVEVYALAAPGDAVAWSGWHGDNPVEVDVGAVRLATGDVAGHSAYLDAGSRSLTSLALVAAGRGGTAPRAPSAPDGGPAEAALADLAGVVAGARGQGPVVPPT